MVEKERGLEEQEFLWQRFVKREVFFPFRPLTGWDEAWLADERERMQMVVAERELPYEIEVPDDPELVETAQRWFEAPLERLKNVLEKYGNLSNDQEDSHLSRESLTPFITVLDETIIEMRDTAISDEIRYRDGSILGEVVMGGRHRIIDVLGAIHFAFHEHPDFLKLLPQLFNSLEDDVALLDEQLEQLGGNPGDVLAWIDLRYYLRETRVPFLGQVADWLYLIDTQTENRIVSYDDPYQLYLLMNNLVGNAVRHSGKGDAVRLYSWVGINDGQELCFVFADDGRGFSEELLEEVDGKQRVFEEGVTSDAARGLGQGMADVWRFTKLRGGKAWAMNGEVPGLGLGAVVGMRWRV